MGSAKSKCIGILTSGGDCPGLNTAIRGVAKAAMGRYGMRVIGFNDGFRGLVENRHITLCDATVSGILTQGGTILGSSREKIGKMRVGDRKMDMSAVAAENLKNLHVDCLVCLGGGGTQKNAYHLHKTTGFPVITLPKTIDNDVAETDITFGFDSALQIATEAIDRLHTTATSHHRIIVCEIMGHRAGWLALGAGIAGGADTILIPEIPYNIEHVAESILMRRRGGKRFSIVAVAEGAMSVEEFTEMQAQEKRKAQEKDKKKKKKGDKKKDSLSAKQAMLLENREVQSNEDSKNDNDLVLIQEPKASRIARQLQQLTGIEARVTSLGHVQRGGPPSAYDRLLCTLFGTRAADLIADGVYNVMVAKQGERFEPVPLERVAGFNKLVPLDHQWIEAARLVGSSFGDGEFIKRFKK